MYNPVSLLLVNLSRITLMITQSHSLFIVYDHEFILADLSQTGPPGNNECDQLLAKVFVTIFIFRLRMFNKPTTKNNLT